MNGVVSRRALLASGLCIATAAATEVLPVPGRIDVRPVDLAGIVPLRFGAWSVEGDGRPIVPDENDRAAIARAYDQSFARVYRHDEGPITMLVIAHGDTSSGMLAIHRPPSCYTAQGFTVAPRGSEPLPAPFDELTAEHMWAVRGGREEAVVYWMTIAGHQTGFGIAQNLAVIRAAWHDIPADGFLIRGSTIGADEPRSYAIVADFLAALLASLPPVLRHQLGG